jgi:Na+-transporting NADH:ubiquinone oxidoreductase subunit A
MNRVTPLMCRRPEQLDAIPRQALVDTLLAGGMWPFLRALPFMDLADPDTVPPSIIVRLGNDEPFGPDPVVYLKDRQDRFGLGMDVLNKLCDRVVVNLYR